MHTTANCERVERKLSDSLLPYKRNLQFCLLMFKFFRRIRRSLIAESKTGKYLAYAAGEVVLVVIGILIALQLNNWNSDRIDGIKEQGFVVNLKRDLSNQLEAIDRQLRDEALYSRSAKGVLDAYMGGDEIAWDSTQIDAVANLCVRTTFVITNPTYTELISSGNIDLIRNEYMKDQIILYYQELDRLEKIITRNNSLFVDQEFVPNMSRLGVLTQRDIVRFRESYGKPGDEQKDYISESSKNKLAEISSRLLNKEENRLQFFNHLITRKLIADIHIHDLNRLSVQTEQLLIEFSNY